MNLRPWMSRRFFAAALALVVLFALLLAAVVRLALNESRLSGDLTEGVMWFSSQAQYEAMRMADASMAFRAGKISPDELQLRFDIMDSRLHLFEEGQSQRQVDALGLSPVIEQLRLKLDNGRTLLPVLRRDDTAAIDSLHDLAIFVAQSMRDVANTGMLDARERAINRRDERRRILFEVLGYMLATLAAGVLVGMILVRDHKIMTRAEAALERERQVSRLHRAFISVVSHQFRTPLSIIDASAQRMIRRGTAMTHDEIASRAEKIRNACLRLTRLMESTLNAARLEQGEISFRPRACDLPQLIRSVCSSQPEQDQDRIDLSIQSLPVWVNADETLLEQAIQNLLSNAAKYSPPGERVLVEGSLQGSDIVISVTDAGVGIPADQIGSIFNSFFRARTAEGIPGTGIGLSFVAQIMTLHGGRADVESVEGRGSTFFLRFPYQKPAPEEPSLPLAAAQAYGLKET